RPVLAYRPQQNSSPLLSRDSDFVFLKGRRQHRYSEEFVCGLRINSAVTILEHLEPLSHFHPHELAIASYRRSLHESQIGEIRIPIGWYTIGGGISVFIKIHRAAELIHPIRLSQCDP